jgi:HSP20 family molecular chaperone IbpA
MINYDLNTFLKDNWLNTNISSFLSSAKKQYYFHPLAEDKKDFAKQLQFAGFDKEEVSVSYESDYLTVEGNSSMLDSQYYKKYYIPSKYYDVNSINVKFEKCILTIECKLKEEKDSKVMKIVIK